MNILIYLFIFISKIIENALATLRLIVVSSGKKWMGAVLQFCIAVIWILATGMVVTNIHQDPIKIIFFAVGSFIGSLVGSFIEESLAMGSNLVMVVTNKDIETRLINEIRKKKFVVTNIDGTGKNGKQCVLMIMVDRKNRHKLIKCIKTVDKDALIISESAKAINGCYEMERST